MSVDVPFLTKESIEREASFLLAEFGQEHGAVSESPIPIEDIIELHLKLTLEIKDFRQIFGCGDVHGAVWFRSARIGIDQSLDPTRNAAKLGRYRFTLAHEAGHWRLHRRWYLRQMNQPGLFNDGGPRPDFVCRSSDKKKPVEWQADQFAANLLMPRDLIRKTWLECRGEPGPIVLSDMESSRQDCLNAERRRRGSFPSGNKSEDDLILEHCSRPMAERFQVSAEAMRYRLEDLGLLVRQRQASLFE